MKFFLVIWFFNANQFTTIDMGDRTSCNIARDMINRAAPEHAITCVSASNLPFSPQ